MDGKGSKKESKQEEAKTEERKTHVSDLQLVLAPTVDHECVRGVPVVKNGLVVEREEFPHCAGLKRAGKERFRGAR